MLTSGQLNMGHSGLEGRYWMTNGLPNLYRKIKGLTCQTTAGMMIRWPQHTGPIKSTKSIKSIKSIIHQSSTNPQKLLPFGLTSQPLSPEKPRRFLDFSLLACPIASGAALPWSVAPCTSNLKNGSQLSMLQRDAFPLTGKGWHPKRCLVFDGLGLGTGLGNHEQ